MEVDFSEGKTRILELIDKWVTEITNDLMIEIQKSAELGNLFDIESNMNTIKEVNSKKEEIKRKVIFAKNTQQVLSALDCELSLDYDDDIISSYLGIKIKIKK